MRETKRQTEKDRLPLGTKYLFFYTYIWMIFSISINLLYMLVYIWFIAAGTFWSMAEMPIEFVLIQYVPPFLWTTAIFVLQLLTLIFLVSRKKAGYVFNYILMGLEILGVSIVCGGGAAAQTMIILLICCIFWLVPHIIYFENRRFLFDPKAPKPRVAACVYDQTRGFYDKEYVYTSLPKNYKQYWDHKRLYVLVLYQEDGTAQTRMVTRARWEEVVNADRDKCQQKQEASI